MKKDIDDLTLKELREMGAKVDINFHGNKNLQDAYNKLKPFTKFGSINKYSHPSGSVWVNIDNDDKRIYITSFIK